jgi:hypothetical protein
MSTNSPWKAALADSTMLRRPQAFHQAVVPKMVFWSKKGEAVAALEAAGFQVVEDQEAIDRLLVRDPTVS